MMEHEKGKNNGKNGEENLAEKAENYAILYHNENNTQP